MPDRPDQPQPPSDGDAKLVGESVPIDLPARLKSDQMGKLSDPAISADAQEQLKREFRRELNVPPQIKLQVLAGAAHSFEQRRYRHRRIMRTQRIAAAALFLVGTALAFKYMAPGKNQVPTPQGTIAMNTATPMDAAATRDAKADAVLADARTLGESAKAKSEAVPATALRASAAAPTALLFVAAPADLDSDGAVSILDAFALARALEPLGGRVKADNASLSKAGFGSADLNNDGFVDDHDVEFISAQAVSLAPLAMHTGGVP